MKKSVGPHYHLGIAFKRSIDILGSIMALIVSSPIMLVIAITIRASMGNPIIFRQQRTGLHGKPFEILKFRTMHESFNSKYERLPDNERLTPLGRKLRSTSLDELPELMNVLKGEMSLVGPRPLLVEYLDRYTSDQVRRHEMKPGLTGWAQINGRNSLSWEDKFKLDLWYIDHWSLWLDIRIVFLTLWKVIRQEGISEQGESTMSEFTGTRENKFE